MYQQRQPEIDLDKILAQVKETINRFLGRFGGGNVGAGIVAVLVLVVGIWLATGFYQVRPAELAATRLFGQFTGDLREPGLHWFWPSPIGKVDKEAVLETRRLELGFRTDPEGQTSDVPGEALMITGDLNITNVQMVVQYRINDLPSFLFNVSDPGDGERDVRRGTPEGATLKDASEAALRQVVGQRSIDDVLTVNREAVQVDALLLLQDMMNSYGAGIEILEVRLQNVRPPDPVRGAFDDVVAARVDKEARINEALAYQQDRVPRARGDAQRVTNTAQGFKEERILRATGEAERFLTVLQEYRNSQEVTRERLYLEALEAILPNVKKFIVSPDTGGNLLQFLPLDESAP